MKKILKRSVIILLALTILFNISIIIQSYSFTHFQSAETKLNLESRSEFVKMAITGIKIPRPVGHTLPEYTYQDIKINIAPDKDIYGWYIPTDSIAKGTVLLFHGYIDNKSSLLPEAHQFRSMGYNTLLIDFMGSGNSYGNQTTMGYLEAKNVYATYRYATEILNQENIILFGFSMGGAAISKAQADYQMELKGIILQATYATFEGTINARADRLGLPNTLFPKIFTFWIGKVNGFNAFEANPIEYATYINIPTLIMCGAKDPNIPKEETEAIFSAINTEKKTLQLFEDAKHESLLANDEELWKKTITDFMMHIE